MPYLTKMDIHYKECENCAFNVNGECIRVECRYDDHNDESSDNEGV